MARGVGRPQELEVFVPAVAAPTAVDLTLDDDDDDDKCVQQMQRNAARCNMPHAVGSVHHATCSMNRRRMLCAARLRVCLFAHRLLHVSRFVVSSLCCISNVLCAMLSCTLHGCAWQAVAVRRLPVGFRRCPSAVACCLPAGSFRSPGVRLHAVPSCGPLRWRVRQATFSYP